MLRVISQKGINPAVPSVSVPGWSHAHTWPLLPCRHWSAIPIFGPAGTQKILSAWGSKLKGKGNLHQMTSEWQQPREGCHVTALKILICKITDLAIFMTIKLSNYLFLSLSCIYTYRNLKRKCKWKEKWEIQLQ